MELLKKIYSYRLFVGLILFSILAFVFQKNLRLDPYEKGSLKEFQEVINERIVEVDQYLKNTSERLDSFPAYDLMMHIPDYYNSLYENSGIVLLGYKNDSLVFWTDNLIPVDNYSIDNGLNNSIVKLTDGWYVVRSIQHYDCKFYGLIHLKNEYSYENKFIKNEFRPEYNIIPNSKIIIDQDMDVQIYNPDGKYLFSVVNNSIRNANLVSTYFSSLFFLLTIGFLLLFLWKGIRSIKVQSKKNIGVLVLAIVLFVARFLMLEYNFPLAFKQLELFKPHLFAISFMVPSLGDLLIHTLLVFYFFLVFYREFKIDISKFNKKISFSLLLVSIIIVYIWFLIVCYYFQSLILHSSISFYIHQLFDLSPYTFVGFLIVILLLSTVFLLIDQTVLIFKDKINVKDLVLKILPAFILFSLLVHFFVLKIDFIELLFFVFVSIVVFYIRDRNKSMGYTSMIVVLLLFSIFSVYWITNSSKIKKQEARKVLVVNLANERDQVAEMLLETLAKQIESDTTVRDLLTWYFQNEGAILEHLQMNYFSGYFIKYDLQISVCDPDDNLTLILDNSTDIVHCYSFFDDIFQNDGTKTQGSNFYFLDNLNGRISYLARFAFKKPEWENEITLFISLDSKLISKELGYPELLLDKRLVGSAALSDYSYAKYREKTLVTRSGDFSYQLQIPENWNSQEEFYFIKDSDFEHLIYNIDEKTQIVISIESLGFVDILASFSYIFVLYYLLLTVLFFILQFPGNIRSFKYDFKNKIKVSMIGVLLLSLIIVGFGTVYYNIDQFEKKLHESVSEKIQSILVEMEHKLGGEIDLSDNYSDYLTYLLTKFSNVFFIDINLYDVNGNLLASSRPQIFEKGLMGKKMNTEAYREMIVKSSGKFIHQESIGDLTYLSAYVPFVNDDNELLGYLNLPYFTKQSELRKETYTIIVAVVNIYFFLILLSIVIAIFITNNITRPLQLIQERFREIDLGKKNEPIFYESLDEIGSLIKEYNRMVEELSENAKKLAKSERESAWREMAKQIAHEIKNPLTPMKLSVQYLQRAWKDKSPDFEVLLNKFTNSLIGQINNLSVIATEFSNFASMPQAKKDKVDVIAKLNDTIALYENQENIVFTGNYKDYKELHIFADKEQMLIIFSNLIQNAIQAIPRDRNGEIKIIIEKQQESVQFTIADNGSGIPVEMREKMFRPNFTTKTSGMGLGLSIVKNIINYSGGDIWYETEMDKGTSIIFTLPLFKQD
jgi:two-component system, NtrC family, nitrogen regulation sensor histidine kinase NtrY